MPNDIPQTIASAAERRSAILNRVSQGGASKHFVPSENGYLEVPVVEVPAGLLVYRADNGRILSELTELAVRQGTTLGRIKERAETAEVQRLLHELLLDKARDPDGPIYDELQRFGRQTEPLLIRRDGVVLNGNRRLAAMRQLHSRDPYGYEQFEMIRAAVLPEGLRQDEFEFIEAALQMAPDLKLEYGWVNRRLKLRQHAEDMDRETIAKAYRLPSASEIETQLGELQLAESYLDWIEQPGQYAKVEDREDAFTKLHDKIDELQAPHLQDIWTLFGFAMIKAEAELEQDILHYYPFADPLPPAVRHWVPRTLAEDHGLVDRQNPGENRPFDKALAPRLHPIVDDHHQAKNTANAVIALADTLKANEQKLVGISRLLVHLRNARSILGEIDIESAEPGQVKQVRAQLAALQELIPARGPEGSRARPPNWPMWRIRSAWRRASNRAKRALRR